MTATKSTPTNCVRISEIIARVDAATPGPWVAAKVGSSGCGGIRPAFHNHAGTDCYSDDGDPDCPAAIEIVTTDGGYYGPSWPDAEFVAHAREDVPYLLAEIARLRGGR
jgi:hypothetical protein